MDTLFWATASEKFNQSLSKLDVLGDNCKDLQELRQSELVVSKGYGIAQGVPIDVTSVKC